jgi:hypothetical protein
MYHFVMCDICGGRHRTEHIKLLNIEEDWYGRDRVTFKCPEDKSTRVAVSSVFQDTMSQVHMKQVSIKENTNEK